MPTSTPSQKSRDLIFSIYAHGLLAVGVVTLAIGSFMLTRNLTGRFVLSEYPIGYEENRCDYLDTNYYPQPVDVATKPSPEEKKAQEIELEKAKAACSTQVAELRSKKQERDLVDAINVLLVGTLITLPHGFLVMRLNRKA